MLFERSHGITLGVVIYSLCSITFHMNQHAFKITILLTRSSCFGCMLISSPHNLNICSDSRGTRFLQNVFEAIQKTVVYILEVLAQ